jgi:hypothetical protein
VCFQAFGLCFTDAESIPFQHDLGASRGARGRRLVTAASCRFTAGAEWVGWSVSV